MKKINSAVAFALALIGACSFASCGKEEADLKITYYKGGYGSAWIENAVEAFKAEKGITVELVYRRLKSTKRSSRGLQISYNQRMPLALPRH